MMKRHMLLIAAVSAVVLFLFNMNSQPPAEEVSAAEEESSYTIAGVVRARDTLESIFDRYNLDKADMHKIYNVSSKKYNLSNIAIGSVYTFELDKSGHTIQRMHYGIDDTSFLSVNRNSDGFSAERVTLPVQRRAGSLYIDIQGNLSSSMPGSHQEYHKLALSLSDIYAWDIDFSHDIRNGDSVKLLVEELWVGDVFKGYGDILAVEFINNGRKYFAYRFEQEGYVDYYDDRGKSLRKALLRSPLKFKYISSGFSRRRLHPRLRIYRPHLGIDYAAPSGTPVSAAGSGTVVYAGRKGQMGRMIRIKHPGGYETYYGHLSRISKKMRKSKKVSQGDIIGYVGATGLATGPHLDYRIKYKGKFVNPLKIRLPRGKSVSNKMMTAFSRSVDAFNIKLSLITAPVVASKGKKGKISG